MDWRLKPARRLEGSIAAPPDKSITHRAIIFSSLAVGESIVEHYLAAEDCMRTVDAFRKMGVRIERTDSKLFIHGSGFKGLAAPEGPIDCGNSGTTVRLLSGALAGQVFPVTMTGDESLSHRPMRRVIEPLTKMGAKITAREGNYLPLTIEGTRQLMPFAYQSPVPSAQVKSCVLLAGLQAHGLTSVEEPVRSRDHTERMLAAYGAKVTVEGTKVSVQGPAILTPRNMRVPGDISSAAFFLVGGAIAKSSKVTVRGVGINPTRDGLLQVLTAMGARITLSNQYDESGEPVADITVENGPLRATTITAGMMPRLIDEIPALVLAATQAEGTTVISGAAELRVKESDRIRTVASELGRMGAQIEERPDGLVITGPTPLSGADTESHGDHRIAMTLAVAALIAESTTRIRDVDCVATSFPSFLDLLGEIAIR